MIVTGLMELLPEAGFIAEEGSVTPNESARWQWIIDPLDGTTNFIHGMPPYAVSIALYDALSKKTVVGVVHEITIGECFYACEGVEGAFLNGEPIRVSPTKELEDSLIITGLAYGMNEEQTRFFVETFDYFNRYTHGGRRLGSAATDLVYVAAGRAEVFYQVNLSPWDVAAGAFIVEKAGGVVVDFNGGNDYIFGRSVIVSNEYVARPVFELLTGKH